MTSRHWTGLCNPLYADDYINHLKKDTFPKLKTLKGFIRAEILKRNKEQTVEFLIITVWDSLESIKSFAGPSPDVAVVPEVVKAMMVQFDAEVRHYEVHSEFS